MSNVIIFVYSKNRISGGFDFSIKHNFERNDFYCKDYVTDQDRKDWIVTIVNLIISKSLINTCYVVIIVNNGKIRCDSIRNKNSEALCTI